MGPRLPGDKGPQARPKNLTHNPFAALAAKLEGQGAAEAEKPAEAAAPPMDAAAMEAPPSVPSPAEHAAPTAEQSTPPTEQRADDGAPAGGSTPEGEAR
jgi:3'-5' exoribonuclease